MYSKVLIVGCSVYFFTIQFDFHYFRLEQRLQSGYLQKRRHFEKAVDQCGRMQKTDKNKNAATATTKYFTNFPLKFNIESKNAEMECSFTGFTVFLINL